MVMHGNPVLHQPKALTQNLAKISAAFLIGLITVFGSALVYSNLEQRKEIVPAVPATEPKQVTSSVEFPASTPIPAHKSPESLELGKDRKQSNTPFTAAVSSKSSTRNVSTPSQPSVRTRVSVEKPVAISSASAGSGSVQVSNDSPSLPFAPNSSVAPRLPSTVVQKAESVSVASVSKVVVPAATTLTVQLSNTLSSDRNQPGDTFQATLAAPLVVDGYLLAETGSAVQGRVEAVRRASLLGGRSELSIVLTELGLRDGQRTRMQTGLREARGTRGHAGNGFIAGKKVAVLPAGAQLTFILVAPLSATGTHVR